MDENSRDVTDVSLDLLRNATPIILFASISLAIGAIVITRVEDFMAIFKYSIISAFMFIFSFIFFIFHKLFKKFNESSKQQYVVDGNVLFTRSLLQFGSIVFFILGFIYLVFIAYQFGIEQPNSNEGLNKPITIFPWIQFYFLSYFVGFIIFAWIKKLIKQKKAKEKINKDSILSPIIIIFAFIPPTINLLMSALEQPTIISLQTAGVFTFLILAVYGALYRISHVNFLKRHKILMIAIVIGIALFSIYATQEYLKIFNLIPDDINIHEIVFSEANNAKSMIGEQFYQILNSITNQTK